MQKNFREISGPVRRTPVPSLLAYSLQIVFRTPALFLASLGINIFSIPTQAHLPGKLRPILAVSFFSCRLPGPLQLCFLARTRLLCKRTPAQRCSDDSRLVLQSGVPGWYHLQDYHLLARISSKPLPAPSAVSGLLMVVWISDTPFPTNAL